MRDPILHLMAGKIASGKSTLAKSLASERSAILLREDHWLSQLYPDQVKTVVDYLRLSRQIRELVGTLVVDVLNSGVNVVLDFPANTPEDRQWLCGLADAAGVSHCVHYIELDDETCWARLHQRNGRTEHEFAATDAEFDLITSYFLAPNADEGIQIEIHKVQGLAYLN